VNIRRKQLAQCASAGSFFGRVVIKARLLEGKIGAVFIEQPWENRFALGQCRVCRVLLNSIAIHEPVGGDGMRMDINHKIKIYFRVFVVLD